MCMKLANAMRFLLILILLIGNSDEGTAQPITKLKQKSNQQTFKSVMRGKRQMSKECDRSSDPGKSTDVGCDAPKLLEGTYSKPDAQADGKNRVTHDKNMPDSIGEAWLEKDGSITLNLRSDSTGASMNAQFNYKKSDKGFDDVIKHLNGIKPGETKQVPPWDESK